MKMRKVGRREFLREAAGASVAAVGFPYLVPGSALGKLGSMAASIRRMGYMTLRLLTSSRASTPMGL